MIHISVIDDTFASDEWFLKTVELSHHKTHSLHVKADLWTVCVCVFVWCVQESLDKQTQHAQALSDKLWMTERQLEELEIAKDTKEKKTSELNSTIFRLETEVQTLRQFPLTFIIWLSQEKVLVLKGKNWFAEEFIK